MIEAVVFDYTYTIANPATKELYPESERVLDTLSQNGYKLGLVSRSPEPEKRYEEILEKKLDRFFSVIDIVPADASKEFRHILEKLVVLPETCVVVGDRIKSEIVEGNRIGMKTIWLRQGKFEDELPETTEEKPDYIIMNLNEVISLIDSIR